MGLTDYTFGDKRIWNAGREYEKERIIKLLEEASIEFEQYDFHAVGVTNGLIALIKGEK